MIPPFDWLLNSESGLVLPRYYLDETNTTPRTATQPTATLNVRSQRHPRRRSHFASHSPTESFESRLCWARRESWLLCAIHQRRPPTFFVTLQWSSCVSPGAIKRFDDGLCRSLHDHANRFDCELRFYSVKEIDRRNLVHAHVLFRTDLPATEFEFLLRERCHRFSDGLVTVTYCEPVLATPAASRYVTKDLQAVRNGEKELCLFDPGLVRLRRQSGYFEPWKVPELRDEGRQIWQQQFGGRESDASEIATFDSITTTLWERCSQLTMNSDNGWQ